MSVIVPTHERPELCIRAVRSALAQTSPPEEVLVWDDGSSAATRVQLREFAALHPRVIYREGEPAGTPAVGRNGLIELAQGDWIAFLDDDDEWMPEKLERQQAYMSSWDVIASGAKRRSNGDDYLPHIGRVSRAMLARDNVLVLSTVTVRRSVLATEFRGGTELTAIEDYALWLDLADAGARIVVTSDVVAIYDDTVAGRLSDDAAAVQGRLARHMVRRWTRRPFDREAGVAAVIHASRAVKLRARTALPK